MRVVNIKWEQNVLPFDGTLGYVKDKPLFQIDKIGKTNPKFILKSFPFESGVFTKANNSKKLFESIDINEVKQRAQELLHAYTCNFIELGLSETSEKIIDAEITSILSNPIAASAALYKLKNYLKNSV